jgi:hypothetical protein
MGCVKEPQGTTTPQWKIGSASKDVSGNVVTVPAARWTVHDVDRKWMVVDEEIRVHGHVTAIAGTFMSEAEASKLARNLSDCPYAGKTVVLAVGEPEPEGWVVYKGMPGEGTVVEGFDSELEAHAYISSLKVLHAQDLPPEERPF